MPKTKKIYYGLEIDESRSDALKDYSQYLIKNHYLKDGETIQEGFARAALCTGTDLAHAQRLYDHASKGHFMWASPVFANAYLPGDTAKALAASCFESGTPVQTINGQKRIADISIGDLVLTHTGTYQPVLNVKPSVSSDCYLLEHKGESHVVTGSHLILTKEHGWVRVDKLDSTVHNLQCIDHME